MYGPLPSAVLVILSQLTIASGNVNPYSPSVTYDIARDLGVDAGDQVLFPTLFRKAIPRYFRTGQDSFSRIIWHRPEEDSAARERFRARELWV